MNPVLINGDLWDVLVVRSDDPGLVDRTGFPKLATTDPVTRTIRISETIDPPLLDRVVLHEIAHAITVSHGLLVDLGHIVSGTSVHDVGEWSAKLMENHSIEAAILASKTLGRPLCTMGYCII